MADEVMEAVPAASDWSANELAWAAWRIKDRLAVLRRTRHELAGRASDLVNAMPSTLARSRADTLAAEVLPLLAACRFLEREATTVLRARRLGRRGLPFWLAGVESTVERVPLGKVLVIGPANYPLFLPGVQVMQGLAAGNSVVWKPGVSGQAVAAVLAEALALAGLPEGVLRVTGESVSEGVEAMGRGVDKVFFTGSEDSGRAVLRAAAETATPVVAELSGCDAVVVLPSANQARVLAALEFGIRLNGSATCMAPRRLMLVGGGHGALVARLRERFAAMEGVLVREPVRTQVKELVGDAVAQGASVCGDVRAVWMKPLLVLDGRPEMRIAQADVFAPVLTVMEFANKEEMLRADAVCPLGLTTAVFGQGREARAVGADMKVGTVLVNDLIVPAADPRIPFGGRKGSGFGVTRGAEGLLEMTAIRTILARRGKSMRHYEMTGETHEELFSGIIRMTHARGLRERFEGLRRMVGAVKRLRRIPLQEKR